LTAMPAQAQSHGSGNTNPALLQPATPATPPPATAQKPATTAPSPPATEAQAPAPQKVTLHLSAVLTEDGPEIKSGLVWRVFTDAASGDIDPKMKLVATSAGGDAEFDLEPGSYIVHAAYGRAGTTKKIDLTAPGREETVNLNAGGVKLSELLTGDIAIPENKLSFDVFTSDADSAGERQALVIGAAANKVIRLNADIYQIVAHYGHANAVVRAEVRVTPGKLTEATLYQKAAEVTLKLVAETGGEALTNVEWQILTPSGEPVADSEGTFATIVLAEGDYSVVARHKDQTYTRNFSVESGYDREIELQATKPVGAAATKTEPTSAAK